MANRIFTGRRVKVFFREIGKTLLSVSFIPPQWLISVSLCSIEKVLYFFNENSDGYCWQEIDFHETTNEFLA